jgi:(1->4)-alpha-D-glucan 1-alpha-D-glucosylmutase
MNHEKITATYRVQVSKDFTLQDVCTLVPHLASLNISHLYLSPVFESSPGSTHGYDVHDFRTISEERGGKEAFNTLCSLVKENGLRLILDIVPNHMGVSEHNPFWMDVLAKGRDSRYWNLFDMRVEEGGKIHLPVLSAPLEELIEKGDVKIVPHEKYGRAASVFGQIFPLKEDTDESKDVQKILERQHYKFTVWTEAFDKISYRRFFDITNLVGVRVEDRDIYELTHRPLLSLLQEYDVIDGVRVDHIDGLADPATYLQELSSDIPAIWVEKILSGEERLPQDWPVLGTTGYEFIERLNGLFVDPAKFETLRRYWIEKIEPRWQNFQECVADGKEKVLEDLFPSELKRLVALSKDIAGEETARAFWKGMTVCLPVYRTYYGAKVYSDADRAYIAEAAEKARKRYGEDFIKAEKVFLPVLLSLQNDIQKQIVREWQQLSGPAMAKGLEDTAHYRYTPLAALNEVRCDADLKEDGTERFYQWIEEQAKDYPHGLLATSTHDTKRSEDARHRLYALSDRPEEWTAFFEKAVEINAALNKEGKITLATQYLLYQSILASWPLDDKIEETYIERLCGFAQKAAREARLQTGWLKPDQDYEDALRSFTQSILKDKTFVSHVRSFVPGLMTAGAVTSLSVLALKILGCGVPDIYQGMEGWDFSLVDPDNRRAPGFEQNRKAFENAEKDLQLLCHDWKSGAVKSWLTARLLKIRRDIILPMGAPLSFERVSVEGKDKDHIVAYEIGQRTQRLYVFCLRHAGSFDCDNLCPAIEASVNLPEGEYRDLLHGRIMGSKDAGDLCAGFRAFPVLVLQRND